MDYKCFEYNTVTNFKQTNKHTCNFKLPFFPIRFTYEAAPVFSVIEEAILKKCISLFGFAKDSEGMFTAGGSQANMYGIVMARHFFYPDIKRTGLYTLPVLVAYTSVDVS